MMRYHLKHLNLVYSNKRLRSLQMMEKIRIDFKITCFQDGQETFNKKIGKLKLLDIVAKIVNPLIIVSFVVIYWLIGFIMYFYPN